MVSMHQIYQPHLPQYNENNQQEQPTGKAREAWGSYSRESAGETPAATRKMLVQHPFTAVQGMLV